MIVGDPRTPPEQARGVVGQRAGHEISWFSAHETGLPGVRHFSMPRFSRKQAATRALLTPVYLRRALGRIQPDLVHVHYAQTGLMAFPLSRFHPLVVTVMGGDILPDQGYRGLPAYFVRMLLDKADCITSKSGFLDEALEKIGRYRSKIRRITWGVDLSLFRPNRDVGGLRKRWDIPARDLVFFDPRLARPFYKKHLILEAFSGYLRTGGPPATLLIAEAFADPDYVRRLRAQASSLQVSGGVRFVGAIPPTEMPDYYVLADLTISAAPSDGLPQTIFEAYACGSFLILSDLPQYAGIVQDGIMGRLVPVGQILPLQDALSWAVANPGIRERAKQLGRRYVEEHADFDRQAMLVNDIYRDLLDAASHERAC